VHSLVGLSRQSVFGRLAGHDEVNDADRLALDPVMQQVVGGQAMDGNAASASQMGRCETAVLGTCQVSGSTEFTNANCPGGSRWT